MKKNKEEVNKIGEKQYQKIFNNIDNLTQGPHTKMAKWRKEQLKSLWNTLNAEVSIIHKNLI